MDIINKVTKIITILFMVAGAVFTGLVIVNAGDLQANPELTATLLNPYFGIAVVLMVIGIASAIVFAVVQLISDPKAAIRVLISIALLGVIYGVSYMMASGNVDAPVFSDFKISSSQSKLIGSLIYLVYLLGAAAILAIMGSAVYKLTLKR